MNLQEAGGYYYRAGFNVCYTSYLKTKYNTKQPSSHKAPFEPWRQLQIKRQTLEEFNTMKAVFATGIGCVLGSSSIRCIDIDGCGDLEFIESVLYFLDLPKKYPWVIRTPNGFHIYIRCRDSLMLSQNSLKDGILALKPNKQNINNFKRIELRWVGFCILPPTEINSNKYSYLNSVIFPSVDDICWFGLDKVYYMICSICGDHENMDNYYSIALTIGNYFLEICSSSTGEYFSHSNIQTNNKVFFNTVARNWTDITRGYIPSHNKILFLDTETTGLIDNPLDYESYPRLIQFFLKKFNVDMNDKESYTEYNYYVKHPSLSLTKNIQDITGITQAVLDIFGLSIEDTIEEILKIDIEGCLLVGHNLEFDLSIIDAEFYKKGMRNPLRDLRTFCTMREYSHFNDIKFPSLTHLHEILFDDLPMEKMHNAKNDVDVLIRCYKILELYGFNNKSLLPSNEV